MVVMCRVPVRQLYCTRALTWPRPPLHSSHHPLHRPYASHPEWVEEGLQMRYPSHRLFDDAYEHVASFAQQEHHTDATEQFESPGLRNKVEDFRTEEDACGCGRQLPPS